ncbi:3-hydroxyacyl-CoA dehydrogenase NAD-binding domain-containing protein [Streptomyces sp. NPDC004728]
MVIGHPFDPPDLMSLVEVVPGPEKSPGVNPPWPLTVTGISSCVGR